MKVFGRPLILASNRPGVVGIALFHGLSLPVGTVLLHLVMLIMSPHLPPPGWLNGFFLNRKCLL